jgi:hypothetical protein
LKAARSDFWLEGTTDFIAIKQQVADNRQTNTLPMRTTPANIKQPGGNNSFHDSFAGQAPCAANLDCKHFRFSQKQ